MRNKFIPTYRDTITSSIKICTSCNHVEELKNSIQYCPNCQLGSLGSWDTDDKFKGFIQKHKPTYLMIHGEKLKEIYKEAMS